MKSHKETALFFTDLQISETIVRFLPLLTSGVVRILIRFETIVVLEFLAVNFLWRMRVEIRYSDTPTVLFCGVS